MASRPNFEEVANTLVTNGAVYVAAHRWSLVDEPAQLYYHLPVTVPNAQKEAIATYLAEEVGDRPADQQIGCVRIDGQSTPVVVTHVLPGELHLYRRVPVYVGEDVAGLETVVERQEKRMDYSAYQYPRYVLTRYNQHSTATWSEPVLLVIEDD